MPEPCGNLTLAAACRRYPVFAPALQAVADLDAGALVAVDGRCGSGKSTLSELAARRLHCPLFHMDDFFLPPGAAHAAAVRPARRQRPL